MYEEVNDITAWQGDTIPLQASKPDTTAETVTLLIGEAGSDAIFSKTATYSIVDEMADLTITDEENVEANIPHGEYTYMLNVVYSDGSELSFPQWDDCDGDVELPKFTIKQRIGNESS